MNEKPRSVYERGAEDGLILGPLMGCAMLLTGTTAYHGWAFVPAVCLLLAVPVCLYVRLARSYMAGGCRDTLSALWLEGICAFFFGGLIMAIICYAAMRWGKPAFVADQFRMVIDVYSASPQPEAQQFAATLQKAVDSRALPTPIEISLELLYTAVFSGSLCSVLFAAIIRRRNRPGTPPPFNN